jgi:HEPN domain-containing protein
MPLDQRWCAFAENDLETAEVLLREAIWNQVCFHAQQSVEKYLKASLLPESRPRTHKIAELLARVDVSLAEDLKQALRRLDRFYIPSRYPDALPGTLEEGMPTQADAESAIQSARDLKDALHQ